MGSTCTHVAAMLFQLEAATKIRASKTVTESKAYWLLPGGVKDVPRASVSDIDFSSAKSKRQKLKSEFHTCSCATCSACGC